MPGSWGLGGDELAGVRVDVVEVVVVVVVVVVGVVCRHLLDAGGDAPRWLLPWVVEGAGGLGAGKTSGAGTRGVSLDVAIGGRTGYSDTNRGESSNN